MLSIQTPFTEQMHVTLRDTPGFELTKTGMECIAKSSNLTARRSPEGSGGKQPGPQRGESVHL